MKTVCMPIKVPSGDCCWEPTKGFDSEVCEYFDNAGGHETCELGFWPIKRDEKGDCLKPPECLKLVDITEDG